MDVSIIIVNWNTRELLLNCLSSVLATTSGLAIEIFVVDNASQDGSSEAVRREFPGVTIIQNDRNRGFARANNQALTRATGRYFHLLNTDAVLTEGSLQGLVSFMDRTPEAGVAACQYIDTDGSRQNSFDNFPTLATELFNKTILKLLIPARYPSKRRVYREPIEVDSVIGACMLVRAEAVRTVGVLDEDYFFFLEETDWCYRMRRAGWRVYHLPGILVYHLQGMSKEQSPVNAWIEYYRSLYLFFKKNRGYLSYYVLRTGKALKLAVNLFLVSLGIGCTLVMNKGLMRRFRIYSGLLKWHLRGCPSEEGLAGKHPAS
jgi:GT2 family glycosyltransferase